MGPEALSSKWFLGGLPETWHAQRIETTTGRGVPDIELCVGPYGRTCWIEMKARRKHTRSAP